MEPKDAIALQCDTLAVVLRALEGVSGRDRLQVLKAAAGAYGHRVLPGLGTQFPGTTPGVPIVGQKLKAPPMRRTLKTASQLELEAKIKVCNTKISAESKKRGQRLEADDPLLTERSNLFRALHERKIADGLPQSGQGCQNL